MCFFLYIGRFQERMGGSEGEPRCLELLFFQIKEIKIEIEDFYFDESLAWQLYVQLKISVIMMQNRHAIEILQRSQSPHILVHFLDFNAKYSDCTDVTDREKIMSLLRSKVHNTMGLWEVKMFHSNSAPVQNFVWGSEDRSTVVVLWRCFNSGTRTRPWTVCLLLTVVRIYRHSPMFAVPTHPANLILPAAAR